MKEVVESYNTLTKLAQYARIRTEADETKYVSQFDLPIIGEKKGKKRTKKIRDYFDGLSQTIEDNSYVELVASFEASVVEKISLSSGEIKRLTRENYPDFSPLKGYEERMVRNRDSFSTLNKVEDLLRGKIDSSNHSRMVTAIKWRNRLAHGKRFEADSKRESIPETYKLLDSIIEEISR